MMMVNISLMMVNNNLVGGWPTPLKNDGVRQLGWWNSQLNGKIKFMFETTNQIITNNLTLQMIIWCNNGYDVIISHNLENTSNIIWCNNGYSKK
jgi:hypothetical protein